MPTHRWMGAGVRRFLVARLARIVPLHLVALLLYVLDPTRVVPRLGPRARRTAPGCSQHFSCKPGCPSIGCRRRSMASPSSLSVELLLLLLLPPPALALAADMAHRTGVEPSCSRSARYSWRIAGSAHPALQRRSPGCRLLLPACAPVGVRASAWRPRIFYGAISTARVRCGRRLGTALELLVVATVLIVMILSGGLGAVGGPLRVYRQGRRGVAGIERVRLPRLRRADLRDGVRVGGSIAAALAARPFVLLGEISFSLYLLHLIVCHYYVIHPEPVVSVPPGLLLSSTGSLSCSRPMWGGPSSKSLVGAPSSASGIDRMRAGCRREATPRRAIARRSCRVLAHRGEWRAPLCRRQLSTSRPVRPQQPNPQQRARCRRPIRR